MAKLNCVTVLAPAKLNLALDVVGLLPNGYHNLDMTMQAITLYERVVLRRSQNLSLTLPGSPVAANDSNTAIKTALKENGAVTALMTGSGAAVFGIFESEEAARSAAEAVRAQWPQVYVARPDRGGARVISPKWML